MNELKEHILSGSLSPVYLLYGPESYLKEEVCTALKATLFASENEAAANTTLCYGADLGMSELLSKASEYPMFTTRQLIIVKQAEKLKKPQSKAHQKKSEEKLEHYLAHPPEFTVLVFDADPADKREMEKTPFTLLKRHRHEFPLIKNPDLFATQRAAAAGWKFNPDALRAFTNSIQPSAREICQEIDKIILYAADRTTKKQITAHDVFDCVGISRTYNVFELEKALGEKNLRMCSGIALMIMEHEGAKEGLGNIVRYLTTFYLRIWKLSQPGVLQQPRQEIAAMLGLFGKQEFFLKNYLGYVPKFQPASIEQAITALQETDAALKGLRPYPDEKFLLLQLMQQLLG